MKRKVKTFDPVRNFEKNRKNSKKVSEISNGVDEELYKKVRIFDLILFSINSVIENKEKCTIERLIKECFTLFPKAFGFLQYPQWPDSRKLDRPLRALRKIKLITGDPKTSFSLTKAGRKIAEETAKNFRQRKLFK
ncbi:MAG: hypothetical protein CO031_00560 [Candidatus Nealsonbacteria bacterium CG_4_9_14_0_2_um_filter_37_38]|uniref:Uncharacterized protein n=1 Tax=Candidatus Nealsonbacteria bacterium CG_4_10_14_0_8_um_filter_37_14 TaxID=1974684 RepID=A0A2M7R6L6_9BACT|nr:MAG: hypothetical protein COV63_00375 [Candidatus Nealsonbacteria bacterium CG11_big_fil_rev_8_21_14_0_20_37_68]PIW91833.1 MAG: hypothetical protein COZ89_03110 [Candidatus Nealsonbacteria bacterium CG_4_8_14_3_um_filter_37_23]PIY88776.1 MAG: hypothetical protein COY73_02805 [Candidatus Nealsonbacteria bacterium CG_4_10_14_0_8_um_filter_37_14]PJC51827.1 MAG: hypothetical protein CO031_00560 [Candidatus Nealsonbacteria bacterium CG_4_9_14_0_2_um_filter_37_38]